MRPLSLLLFLAALACAGGEPPAEGAAARRVSRYNVVWSSPSKDASGAMPIGNGEIAAVVYAIEDGDLFLLLSKNAYTIT